MEVGDIGPRMTSAVSDNGYLVSRPYILIIYCYLLFTGVEVGDIGPRMTSAVSDNGYLIMKNIRIPRLNMLMKSNEVRTLPVYNNDVPERGGGGGRRGRTVICAFVQLNKAGFGDGKRGYWGKG